MACILSAHIDARDNETDRQDEIDIRFDDIYFDGEEIEQPLIKKMAYLEEMQQVAQMAGVHIFIAALTVKEFCSQSYSALKKYIFSLIKKA